MERLYVSQTIHILRSGGEILFRMLKNRVEHFKNSWITVIG